jgi:hypothetical protein
MSAHCKNCGQRIVQIITTDGIGWYHPAPDKPDGTRRVRESCYGFAGLPFAEPREVSSK